MHQTALTDTLSAAGDTQALGATDLDTQPGRDCPKIVFFYEQHGRRVLKEVSDAPDAMSLEHERWMRLAIEEGELARGTTGDNPWVGCAIVGPSGELLGRGHTLGPGEHHAEIAAALDAHARGTASLARRSTPLLNRAPSTVVHPPARDPSPGAVSSAS